MIKYSMLDGDVNSLTRHIYEEAFNEDSLQFVDYFYKVDAPKNKVFIVSEDDEIISMLHLHKYDIWYKKIIPTFYMVAVATKKKYKKRGYFRKNLINTFNWLNDNKYPFIFLMPIAEEIYKPFMFNTIVDIGVAKIFARDNKNYTFEISNDAQILHKLLQKIGNFEIIKDINYIKRQIKALIAQNGNYVIVKKNKDVIAVLRYVSDAKNVVILDIVITNNNIDKNLCEDIAKEFAKFLNVDMVEYELNFFKNNSTRHIKYMYRIINLEKFIDVIKPKLGVDFSINVKVNDNCIKSNNGIFKISTIKNNFIMQKVDKWDKEVGIDELLEILLKNSDIDTNINIHEVI